jgi:urease accessory protein
VTDSDAPADLAALTSLQLADSFLPVGGFSSSYAIEEFVNREAVTDADDLAALLETYLRRQVGPAEFVALRAAHGAAVDEDVDELVRADHRLHAVTLPREFRESATRSGRRLCDLWRETHDSPMLGAYLDRDAPRHYAVVLGAVAAGEGISERQACLVHGYSFCSDLLGAAQRLLSLGHTDAQRVLADLKPVVAEAVETSADRDLTEMTPFAPLIDVAAAHHERADRRLFVS